MSAEAHLMELHAARAVGVAEGRRQALQAVHDEPEPGEPSAMEYVTLTALTPEQLVEYTNCVVMVTKRGIAERIEGLANVPPEESSSTPS